MADSEVRAEFTADDIAAIIAEVIAARGDYDSLSERLAAIEAQLSE